MLHAGYIFEHDGTRIVFDPIFENPFSTNCYAFPSVRFDLQKIKNQTFSAIFISHFHDDHCSLESLNLLNRATPLYIHCVHDELLEMIRRLGFESVNRLEFNQAVRVGSFTVTSWRPMNDDVDSMIQLNVASLNILNVVDSVVSLATLKDLTKIKWDLILWPFQTMRETAVIAADPAIEHAVKLPEDWIEDLRELKPNYLVPSACQFIHEDWSWYNQSLFPISYKQFEDELSRDLPDINIVRMNPGEIFSLSSESLHLSGRLDWISPVGNQNVDYDYRPTNPPATSEIARNFAPLSEQQSRIVIEFCKKDLLTRFAKLETTPYFATSRIWKLSVFDHQGLETFFCYRIRNQEIELTEDSEGDWETEVSINKLYNALENGEALTSMYVRLRSKENALDDPLIRTLFTGRVVEYQRSQLQKIKLLENAQLTKPQR